MNDSKSTYYEQSGEKAAIRLVLELGEMYGYGNLISELKRAWAIRLIKNWGTPKEAALELVNVAAYPIEQERE